VHGNHSATSKISVVTDYSIGCVLQTQLVGCDLNVITIERGKNGLFTIKILQVYNLKAVTFLNDSVILMCTKIVDFAFTAK